MYNDCPCAICPPKVGHIVCGHLYCMDTEWGGPFLTAIVLFFVVVFFRCFFFFSKWREEREEKRAMIGPPAVSLAGRKWPSIECWLDSFVIFQGDGGPDPCLPPPPPPPSGYAHCICCSQAAISDSICNKMTTPTDYLFVNKPLFVCLYVHYRWT